MASLGHEWFRPEPVEFGEPLGNIREHRLHENTAPGSAKANTIAFEPELTRQPYGLAPAVTEEPCGRGHRVHLRLV